MKRLIATLLFAMTPALLGAQGIGFESLLSNITDVNFFYSCWKAGGNFKTAGCPGTTKKAGYGVEVLYSLGKIHIPWTKTYSTNTVWIDTTRVTPPEIVTQYKKAGTKDVPYWYLQSEFALSYSQFSGFGSADPTYDLQGTVRELPGLAMYFTIQADKDSVRAQKFLSVFSPYIGFKSGLIQLNNVQILDRAVTDTFFVYSGTSSAFQVGFVYGLVISPLDKLSFFIEGARNVRRFANIQWAGASGNNKVPRKFPTVLDFSGSAITTGLQLQIKSK